MSPPEDIRTKCEGVFKGIILLRSMRLYPGAISSRLSDRPATDTTGIDAFMLLIRSMLSRGYEIKDPTAKEEALIALSWLDVGWVLEEDEAWKQKVIDILDPNGEFSADISQLDLRTILRLTTEVGLPHMHLRSEPFQLLAPMAFHRSIGSEEWIMDLSVPKTHNSWVGTSSLNDRMSRQFKFAENGKNRLWWAGGRPLSV